jgi:molybdopterin-guanine dinucleotide biosynthesis protein A
MHPCAVVPFDQAGDDPLAFFNANTLAQLHALDSAQTPC